MTPPEAAILIVDDNADNRYTLSRRLMRQGYTNLEEATNGKEALERLEARPFDLVLLDIMMPEMDGYQVLKRMKADATWRHIPVISSASFSVAEAKRGTVPITLFVWGPGRIVPVRLTSFSVEEEAFSPILYPIRATVTVGLRLLHPSELANHPNEVARTIATTAYTFTRTQKQVLAAANIANTVESILGMLPF